MINSKDITQRSLNVPTGPFPFVKAVKNNEFLLLATNELGIFISSEEKPINKTNLHLSKEKPL